MDTMPNEGSTRKSPNNLNFQKPSFQCSVINDFALSLIYLNTIDEVVWYIAKDIAEQMGLMDCVVYLLDMEKDVLVTRAAYGPKNPFGNYVKNPMEIQLGEGVVGAVGRNGIPEIIKDTRNDGRFIEDIEPALSEMAIPIIYEDKVIGVIDSEHPEVDFFRNAHLISMTTIAAMAATRIMNIRNQEKLRKHQEYLEQQVDSKTKELQNTIASLNRSNKDLESFAFAISHDLREPLRTIKGFVQIIQQREENLSDESQKFMNFVVDGATRMNEMMEGLLEYSRLEHTDDIHQSLDMNEILMILIAGLRASIEEKNARIVIGDLPSFFGNKTQIMQLFQNLISNAIKFCKDGETPLIDITGEDLGDRLVFRIKDYGKGIPHIVQKHVFKLFYKGDKNTKNGSGIGLTLCKKIVEYHNGTIDLESFEGIGTTFTITFPKLMEP